MFLIHWAATTATCLGVKSLAWGLSCTGLAVSLAHHKTAPLDINVVSLAPNMTSLLSAWLLAWLCAHIPLWVSQRFRYSSFHGCAPHSGSKPHHQLLGSTPWPCVSDCFSPSGFLCILWSNMTAERPCTDEHISLSYVRSTFSTAFPSSPGSRTPLSTLLTFVVISNFPSTLSTFNV